MSHPSELPQTTEPWGMGSFLLKTWLIDKDPDEPVRPTLLIIVNLEQGLIVGQEMLLGAPSEEDLRNLLYKTMGRPMKGTGEPRRPQIVYCNNASLAEVLEPHLNEIGVTCEARALPALDELVEQLHDTLPEDTDALAGVMSEEGVTVEVAQDFFTAAAAYYRAEPWVSLRDGQILQITIPALAEQSKFISVMGNAGMEYGLALYDTWRDVENLFKHTHDPLKAIPPQGNLTLFFDLAHLLAFEDLTAIEQYDWDIPNKNAYPSPVFFHRTNAPRRPTVTELQWLTAALKAINFFSQQHLTPDGKGDLKKIEVTLAIPTLTAEINAIVKYPAGKINFGKSSARPMPLEESWEDEPLLAKNPQMLLEQFFNSAFDEYDFGDEALNQAQRLMYEAWDAPTKKKQVQLAEKALKISPNCADAYVLLAEDKAKNLNQAIEFYQAGVHAGERALGKNFFEKNAGHFWLLLETRPYMRARAGLANCLNNLKHFDEAIAHYQELLRLNPNDNQGNRYTLAMLLLNLNRDADLLALLQKYKKEYSAQWFYTWALIEFRQTGAKAKANKRLQKALAQNPLVPLYLTAQKRIPPYLPESSNPEEIEAIEYASNFLHQWRQTPSAIDWLKDNY